MTKNHAILKKDTVEELIKRARAEKNARKKMRLLAIAHFLEGKNRTEIAAILHMSRRIINDWVQRYLNQGLQGLESKKPTGRSSYLSQAQKAQLCRYIKDQSQRDTGGRLTGESIHQYIQESFSVTYHPNAIYTLLKKLGFSWVTSRSKHPKQSQEAQETFKKNQI